MANATDLRIVKTLDAIHGSFEEPLANKRSNPLPLLNYAAKRASAKRRSTVTTLHLKTLPRNTSTFS